MRVAVMYSGALRTIRKTMRYFKQNVLLGSHVHVFACVQNDTTLPNSEWEEWIRQEMGDHLKSIVWFSLTDHQDWLSLRNKQVEQLLITDSWKDYLKTSGSIIEYLQLNIAYKNMYLFEQHNGFTYNYIIRCRTDNIFAKPVDFHWLNWSDAEVGRRIDAVSKQLTVNSIEPNNENIIKYFMATLMDDILIDNIKNIRPSYFNNKNDITPISPKDVNNYIKSGAFILTIRANNLYIVRRDYFYLIPYLAYSYGFMTSPYVDPFWFNAENQFQAACYHSGLTVFNYDSHFDSSSLYEYEESRYFDENFNIINPYMLFCVVRN